MPIEYTIDHSRRLIVARGKGVFAHAEVFEYQREVCSRPELAGYDELVDMTEVQEIVMSQPAASSVPHLAAESAASDPRFNAARFAIVAPQDVAFGLGRMYQTYRGLDARSTKQVGVFRTTAEALEFLGIEVLGEAEFATSQALQTVPDFVSSDVTSPVSSCDRLASRAASAAG